MKLFLKVIYTFFIHISPIDLPKLHSLFYEDCSLQGDNNSEVETVISGHNSFSNTLTMRSIFLHVYTIHPIDLPSLSLIKGDGDSIHSYIGKIVIESILLPQKE